jgi:hypothetical protein
VTETMQELRDRITELEGLLDAGEDYCHKLMWAFGLSRKRAQMLGVMLTSQTATRMHVWTILYGDRPECDQPEVKVLDVMVAGIRRALDLHGIQVETIWGTGYRISVANKAKIRAVVEGQP